MSPTKAYEDRYCLFLDILGFRSIVEASSSTTGAVDIFFSLKRIAETFKYKSTHVDSAGNMTISSRTVSQFSDSVVVSYLATEPGALEDILHDVLQLQIALVRRKLLVRGAITRGHLFHESDFVFGPALNEAVELEKLASYPRVIMDRDLLAEADLVNVGSPPSAVSPLSADLDGQFFIDYFAVQPEDFNEDWGDLVEYLIDLRELVRHLSRRREPSLRLKHGWMRQKYNRVAIPLEKAAFRTVNGHQVPDDEEDHIINVTRFR